LIVGVHVAERGRENQLHASDVLRRLEGNLFPEIGERAIAEISAPVGSLGRYVRSANKLHADDAPSAGA